MVVAQLIEMSLPIPEIFRTLVYLLSTEEWKRQKNKEKAVGIGPFKKNYSTCSTCSTQIRHKVRFERATLGPLWQRVGLHPAHDRSPERCRVGKLRETVRGLGQAHGKAADLQLWTFRYDTRGGKPTYTPISQPYFYLPIA